MPTVIDELVILLNLRTNDAERQLNAVDESVQDLREHSSGLDGVFKDLSKSLGAMAGGFTLMIAAVAAAKATFDLFKDTIDETADTSRLAERLNMDETALRQWKMAAEDAKASGDDMMQTLAEMAKRGARVGQFGPAKSLLDNREALTWFQGAGGNIQRVMGGGEEAIFEIARVTKILHEQDKSKKEGTSDSASAFLEDIGKGNLYNLLVLGEEGIKASLEANRKNAEMSKESGERAKNLQEGIIDLGQEVNKLKLTISEELVPPLTSFVKFLNQVMGNSDDPQEENYFRWKTPEELEESRKLDEADAAKKTNFDSLLEEKAKIHKFDAEKVRDAVNQASAVYGVDKNLLLAQAFTESSFNPTIRSNDGAVGFGQQTPIAVEELNKRLSKEAELRAVIGKNKATMTDALDPVKSLWMQASIMGNDLARYKGNERFALAAYIGGQTGGVEHGNKDPAKWRISQDKETLKYLSDIRRKLGRPLNDTASYRDIVNSGMPKPTGQQSKEGVQIHINKMDVNAKDATGADKFAQQILKNQTFTQMQTAVTQ
jgi:flavodoxin